MNLQILGSSSKCNCYILGNDTEALIIEAGVRVEDVKAALDFNISKVAGCIVTHEHMDHAKSIKKVMAAGIDDYSSKGTFGALAISGPRALEMTPEVPVYIGPFKVLPFPVEHDCAEPFGFMIKHPDCGNVLFATDTGFLTYTFDNLNQIIIEANYSEEILEGNIASGRIPEIMRNRVLGTHMDLNVLKGILKANDLTQVNNIVLIHLSDGNSNEVLFKKEIEEFTGKKVIIADNDMTINFNITPF